MQMDKCDGECVENNICICDEGFLKSHEGCLQGFFC